MSRGGDKPVEFSLDVEAMSVLAWLISDPAVADIASMPESVKFNQFLNW